MDNWAAWDAPPAKFDGPQACPAGLDLGGSISVAVHTGARPRKAFALDVVSASLLGRQR